MKQESWTNPGVIQQVNNYADKKIFRINIDEYPNWAKKYNVSSIPTIIIVDAKTMKETAKTVGFISGEQLDRFLRYPDNITFYKGESSPIRNHK